MLRETTASEAPAVLKAAAQFREQGYALVPQAASASQIAALRTRARGIVDEYDPSESSGIFSARGQTRYTDEFFLTSARRVRCFLELDAVDGTTGQLRLSKHEAINKIGHALHDEEPVFDAFSRSPLVRAILAALGWRAPLLVQSMYIFKHARVGGEVSPHRDATYLRTTGAPCVGFWWALEEATRENGCLRVVPASHHQPVEQSFVVDWQTRKAEVLGPSPEAALDDMQVLECPAGTLVVFDGRLVHGSAHNSSGRSREAFTLHVVEGEGTRWDPSNWLQPEPSRPFRGLE